METIYNVLCRTQLQIRWTGREIDSSYYNQSVIKSIRNTTAKLVQEKYFYVYQRYIRPFKNIMFNEAKTTHDSKTIKNVLTMGTGQRDSKRSVST